MTSLRRLPAVTAAVAMACALTSCQAIAWPIAALAPPQKVKALYTLPADKKVLVFVDDLQNPVHYPPVKRDLAEAIGKELMAQKAVGATIPYERVLDLMAGDKAFNDLGVANVGRKVGADVVVYVEIKSFKLREAEGSPLWEGQLGAAVRVVDAWATKKDSARLWPKDAVEYNVPAVGLPVKEDPNADYGAELAKTLSARMADRVAKLFYDHEVPAMAVDEK